MQPLQNFKSMQKTILSISILFAALFSLGQTFHASLSDYYYMIPHDFAEINDSYFLAVSYGNEFDEFPYSFISKFDSKGNEIKRYYYESDEIIIRELMQLDNSTFAVCGQIGYDSINYPIIFIDLFDIDLNMKNRWSYKAERIDDRFVTSARLALNKAGNIICCLSNYTNKQEIEIGTYFFALSREFDLISESFINLRDQKGILAVEDIMPFEHSDSSLVIINNRVNFIVDAEANIVDTLTGIFNFGDSFISAYHTANQIGNYIYDAGVCSGGDGAIGKYDLLLNQVEVQEFGENLWQNAYGYTNTLTNNGKHLFTLSINEWATGSPFSFLDNYMTIRKIDTSLNLIWEKRIDANGMCYFPFSIRATSDGGIAIAATRNHYETEGHKVEAYLVKLDSAGYFDTTTVSIPENMLKINIYPNPGSNNLNITLQQEFTNATFSLYTLTGQKIQSEQLYQSNSQINTNHLLSGIYIYEIQSNNEIIGRGKWVKE